LVLRHTAAEFCQEPDLAHARLADHPYHLTLPRYRRRQVVREQR
jgi:hypothetical protein